MKSTQLTVRSLLLAAFGSILITASSMYVALRMSALPWPTVFVAILSLALIKLLGNGNIHEVNIAQTGMSAGAMVAGGIAFTLPGLWISNIYKTFNPTEQTLKEWFLPKFFPVLLITLAGTIAGTVLCHIMRRRFIEKDGLPFPIGSATTNTLQAGDEGGKKSLLLFITMGITAIFTVFRDVKIVKGKTLIPQGFETNLKGFPIALMLTPMAVGIGYIIGFVYCAWWLIGGIISKFIFSSWGVRLGTFKDIGTAGNFGFIVAVGLMVGSGIGIIINFIKDSLKNKKKNPNDKITAKINSKKLALLSLIAAVVVFLFSVLAGLSILPTALLLIALIFACSMSSAITGQTGINPMEIFGIIVLLAIRLFVKVDNYQAFIIAGIVAVACGFSGDMLNDYKIGYDLGTDPTAQTISQLIGAIIGSIVAVLALFAIIVKFGGVGGQTGLSAVQAFTVTSMINGIGDPVIFTTALLLGTILYLHNIPAMIIGIGMLLPFGMTVAIFFGGLISAIVKRFCKPETEINGQILGAGLLGGEGLAGTIIAIIQMFMMK